MVIVAESGIMSCIVKGGMKVFLGHDQLQCGHEDTGLASMKGVCKVELGSVH